jgi:hypothetical protein
MIAPLIFLGFILLQLAAPFVAPSHRARALDLQVLPPPDVEEPTKQLMEMISSITIMGVSLTVILAGAFQLATKYPAFQKSYETMSKDVKKVLSPDDIKRKSEKCENVKALEEEGKYVTRTDLEERITSILERTKPDDNYYVIYGPKGCGKSILMEKSIMDKKGVVKVLISSAFDKSTILQVMSDEINGKGSPAVTEEELLEALRNAKMDGRLPTVVFEIERGDGYEQTACITAVRSLSKIFAKTCICFIVLSEANAILVFGRDIDREVYILVPDLTVDQALEYIRASKLKDDAVSEKEMMDLFDNVGTNPAMLLRFVNRGVSESVQQFIRKRQKKALQDLVVFPLKPILKALKENPEGVSPAYFKNEKFEGIDMSNPEKVGAAMSANALLYDIEAIRYQVMSPAHRIMLENYHIET